MKIKIGFLIFFFSCTILSNAQNLNAYLLNADTLKLYEGIVNSIRLEVLDLQNPCKRPTQIQVSGTNLKIAWPRKNDMNFLNLLPGKGISYIEVYVEQDKVMYGAGKLVFKAIPLPDTNDVVFRDFVPIIKRNLTDESFNKKGKSFKSGRFEASISNGAIVSLFSGRKNLISVTAIDSVRRCEDSSDLILESDNARIQKVGRKTFAVTPNHGVKQCNIKIYALVGNKKILLKSDTIRVRKNMY
jgi:hypothetical protein